MGMSCARVCVCVTRARALSLSLSFARAYVHASLSCTLARWYIPVSPLPSPGQPASPRLRARPSRGGYTRSRIVRLYTVVRRREERPRWHGSALRYSGFLREGRSTRGTGSASISLPGARGGGTLSHQETQTWRVCGGSAGKSGGRGKGKQESECDRRVPRVLPAFSLRRGEPTWAVPDGDWMPRRVGLGTSVAPRGLCQSGAPVVAFLSCYLRRGRRRTAPPSGASRRLPRARTVRAYRPPRTRSPCVARRRRRGHSRFGTR